MGKLIRLPIHFYTEEYTDVMEDLGIEAETEVRDMYFISIAAFAEALEGGTIIHSNGSTFLTDLPLNEVIELLKD